MADPRIPLKNPILAGVLAFLVPGAGHLYQGRYFKAAVFFVCILGSLLYGMFLSDWTCVYYMQRPGKRVLGFYAQAGVGLPAIFAMYQTRRYEAPENGEVDKISRKIEAPFVGRVFLEDEPQQSEITEIYEVEGTVTLQPDNGPNGREVQGTFVGKASDGRDLSLNLRNGLRLGPAVSAGYDRSYSRLPVEGDQHLRFSGREQYFLCDIRAEDGERVGLIEGVIPRGTMNWLMVPLEEPALQFMYDRLGKLYEVALVFTWIAGLLNILAIWDAVSGPTYGYGDEPALQSAKSQPNQQSEASPSVAPSPPLSSGAQGAASSPLPTPTAAPSPATTSPGRP